MMVKTDGAAGAVTAVPESRPMLNGIQILRAIGCLSILVAHCAAYAEMNYEGFILGVSLNYWGRYGMLSFTEFFFAISGFLIALAIANSDEGTVFFLKKRFLRIYPTYWCAILLCIVIYLSVTSSIVTNISFPWIFTLLPVSAPYALKVEWTLIYEIVFYLICALFATKRRSKYFGVALCVWGVVIVVGSWRMGIGFDPIVSMPETLFSRRNFAFVAGCLTYYLYRRFGNKINLSQAGSWTFAVLSVILFLVNYQYLYVGTLLGQVLHYALLIPSLFFFAKVQVSNKNPMVRIGNYSYGIYLIHATLLDVIFILLNRFGVPFGAPAFLVAVCVAVVGGIEFGMFDVALGNWIKRVCLPKGILRRSVKYLIPVLCIALLLVGAKYIQEYITENAVVEFETFEEENVVGNTDGAYVAGWVDIWEVTPAANDRVNVRFDGWAYDPINNCLVDQIVVAVGDKVLPVKTTWYDRSGVAEVIGNPILTICGVAGEITVPVAEIQGQSARMFVVLADGRYLELNYESPLIIL